MARVLVAPRLPAELAAARHHRRPDRLRHPRPGGHGLRGTGGRAPELAFYAAPAALLAYAALGTSRQLVVAVSSAIAIMSAATIGEIAVEGSAEFVALTAALAILAGLISIAAGVLKLGRIAQFFSESVLTGFVFGLALLVC